MVKIEYRGGELQIPLCAHLPDRGLGAAIELPTREQAAAVGIAQGKPAALIAGRSRIDVEGRSTSIEHRLSGLEVFGLAGYRPLVHFDRSVTLAQICKGPGRHVDRGDVSC